MRGSCIRGRNDIEVSASSRLTVSNIAAWSSAMTRRIRLADPSTLAFNKADSNRCNLAH